MSELSTTVMSEHDAHRITERIRYTAMIVRDNVAKLQELVAEAQDGQAHVALGYASWTAYIADVFSDAPLKLERQERREVVAWLSGEGMSTRAIAPIVGVTRERVGQIRREVGSDFPPAARPTESDLMAGSDWTPEGDEPLPPFDPRTGEILDDGPGPFNAEKVVADSIETARKITGMDGKTYTQPKETAPRRPALNDQFFNAVFDMTKQIERVARLTEDDRFNQNKEKVAQKHLNDLLRSRDLLQQVIEQLN